LKLYSYQENALNAIDSDPSFSQLISMPTGTGKTVTFLSAIQRKKKKSLVLVHRQELLDQTYEKAKALGFSEEEISTIDSEHKGPIKALTIAMVPTLVKNVEKYSPDSVEMCVVDEAHHAVADSYQKIFEYFQIFEKGKTLLGFTATPLRGDRQQLSPLFHSHSFKMTLSEATQNGYICPVHGMRIDIERSLEEIDSVSGDYDISKLDRVMNCPAVTDVIVSKCQHLNKVPALIFCTSIDHAKNVAKALRSKGKKALCISCENSKKYINKAFSLLKEGRVDFLTNAVKLSEGFDYPPIQSIILARPTRSPVLYKQMIGRGLRKFEGKHDCFVLEFSGNDPRMIRWEDIDENCTFQSSTLKEKADRSDAEKFYRARFGSPNLKVLGVRISPFKFYECYIRRLVSFKQIFRFVPFTDGFCVFEFKRSSYRVFNTGVDHYAVAYVCFWKQEFKSFYVWSYGRLPGDKFGNSFKNLERLAHFYCCEQPGQFGKWYPSEEEPATQRQKNLMNIPKGTSARKAEMLIEDSVVKRAINKFWINGDITLNTYDDGSHSNPILTI
jgi:superfamily II DNA or RNA helicase